MPPAEHKVLVLESHGSPMVVHSKPVPVPSAGQLLVRIEATGLNPADWKIRKRGVPWFKVPGPLGFEGAGVVEEVGDGVERVVSGDRMFVDIHPLLAMCLVSCYIRLFQGIIPPDASTFQQYALVPSDFVIKIPSILTFDEAASMPLGIATSFVGLYAPKSDKQGGGAGLTPFYEQHGKGKYAGKPIVVLGGATSMGQYGKHHHVIIATIR
jgi:NADPH:quinone reductase-like Zn-dependent oxidoreductase